MTRTADMIKILKDLRGNRGMYRTFEDTIEALAIVISNGCDVLQFDAREARYLEIVKGYTREELDLMARFLALLVCEMEVERNDYLGQIFMLLELGSNYNGQFFTPYTLCQLMARLTIDQTLIETTIDHRGYVTMHEPAVGAGGMVLAAEEAMCSLGHPGVMHVTCVDVDLKAVHMAYLQLSLAGIPAIVIHGNSLTLEQWSTWYTPAHIFGGWWWQPRHANGITTSVSARTPAPTADVVIPTVGTAAQLNLFEAA